MNEAGAIGLNWGDIIFTIGVFGVPIVAILLLIVFAKKQGKVKE